MDQPEPPSVPSPPDVDPSEAKLVPIESIPRVDPLAHLTYDQLAEAILDSFQGRIARRRATWRYIGGALFAMLTTSLLIAVYLAAVFVAVAMVFFIPHKDPAAWIIRIVGLGFAVVLIRPIVRLLLPAPNIIAVTRDEQPLLFAFVDRVCDAVNAPRPTEILVDQQSNAGVKMRRGFVSLLSNDLTLKIGLPLVRGMTLEQFASVLAHEFGHLSQTAGLRLSWFATTVTHWFGNLIDDAPAPRGVYQGRLPYILERIAHAVMVVVNLLGWTALVRYFFYLLGSMSWYATSFLSREMEYDADRCAARLVGGEKAARALDLALYLGAAEEIAQAELDACFRDGALPEDLSGWITARLDDFSPEVRQALVERVDQQRVEWAETHPDHASRVAKLTAEADQGVFLFDGPATLLFADLPELARRTTLILYAGVTKAGAPSVHIIPTAEALARRTEIIEDRQAGGRFWPAPELLLRPLPIVNAEEAARGAEVELSAWHASSRADAERESPGYAATRGPYHAALVRQYDLTCAEALAGARVPFPFQLLELRSGRLASVQEAQSVLETELNRLYEAMAPFEKASTHRLFAALALTRDPAEGEEPGPHESRRAEIARYVETLRLLNTHIAWVQLLGRTLVRLSVLLPANDNWQIGWAYWKRRREAWSDLHKCVAKIDELFRDQPHPFAYGHGESTIADYLKALRFGDQPKRTPLELAACMVSEFVSLLERLTGRLARLAEASEKALGLEPLPAPDPPPKEEPGAPAPSPGASADSAAAPTSEPQQNGPADVAAPAASDAISPT